MPTDKDHGKHVANLLALKAMLADESDSRAERYHPALTYALAHLRALDGATLVENGELAVLKAKARYADARRAYDDAGRGPSTPETRARWDAAARELMDSRIALAALTKVTP